MPEMAEDPLRSAIDAIRSRLHEELETSWRSSAARQPDEARERPARRRGRGRAALVGSRSRRSATSGPPGSNQKLSAVARRGRTADGRRIDAAAGRGRAGRRGIARRCCARSSSSALSERARLARSSKLAGERCAAEASARQRANDASEAGARRVRIRTAAAGARRASRTHIRRRARRRRSARSNQRVTLVRACRRELERVRQALEAATQRARSGAIAPARTPFERAADADLRADSASSSDT